jgi:hypothetical protein
MKNASSHLQIQYRSTLAVVLGILIGGCVWASEAEPKANDATGSIQKVDDNVGEAFRLFVLAQTKGSDFLLGKKPETNREELIACLKDEPALFNVIYSLTLRAKDKAVPVQHALFTDADHMNIKMTAKGMVKEGVNIHRGFTNDDRPILIATKVYPPPEGDKTNLGGELFVIVLAKEEK